MNFPKTIYRVFSFLICLMLALSGCSNEDDWMEAELQPIDPETMTGNSAFITLSVSVPAEIVTRAYTPPAGGEEGDGTTPGTDHENSIENLTVIFYQKENEETLNSAVDAKRPLLAIENFKIVTANEDMHITETREVALKDGTYQMLVVANAPQLALTLKPGEASLKDLCDAIQHDSPPWTADNGVYSNFVMSSYDETTVTLKAAGTTQDRPLRIEGVKMQRLAARVDFLPKGESVYAILNYSIRIDAVKVINRMIAGTYLLKRTATDAHNGPYTYLGKEEAAPDKRATNYVIDPWTVVKTVENVSKHQTLYEEYAGETHLWNDADNLKNPESGKDYYTLAYVQENTTDKEAQLCGYSTGIMIRATAIPEKVINASGSEVENSKGVIDLYVHQQKVYENAAALTARTGITADNFEAKGVKVYLGGVMYYPYFIRHCYNDGVENAIMEFAIVRNNVYKLQVHSFSSLGNTDDTVDPDVPSKETFVKIGASVHPWNELSEENIVM